MLTSQWSSVIMCKLVKCQQIIVAPDTKEPNIRFIFINFLAL